MTVVVQRLRFPDIQMQLESDGTVAISIQYIKSRNGAVLYPIVQTYNVNDTLMQSQNCAWFITKDYETYYHNFTFNNPHDVKFVRVYFQFFGVTSENPVWFTEIMLSSKEYDEETSYHVPNQVEKDLNIDFLKNNYVNLYDEDGDYLQIIRPNQDRITNNTIYRTENCTILAPHIEAESEWDNPVNIFYEVMNQREQLINIEK